MFVKHKKSLVYFACLALLATLFSPDLGQAKTDEDMVKSIMKLRAEIEALYTKIDGNKDSYKAQMKSLALQSADSEAQINRKSISIKLANLDFEKINVTIANTATETVEIAPLLKDAFARLDKSIKEGIPFKLEERLSALNKIKAELEKKLITQERALALLWASYDDNIRLTKEIGLFKQTIHIKGKNVLANVAKIGTVMLYFSTPDNQVGYVTKDGTQYNYKTVSDKKEKKEIVALFDALNKQIRTGYFTLPNALVFKGGKS